MVAAGFRGSQLGGLVQAFGGDDCRHFDAVFAVRAAFDFMVRTGGLSGIPKFSQHDAVLRLVAPRNGAAGSVSPQYALYGERLRVGHNLRMRIFLVKFP